MCVRLHVVYTLSALWRHESGKQPRSLSARWAQSQAKETHMVHRWKATPVCDVEPLLSLICEDKPIHEIWSCSLHSVDSE